MVLTFVEEKDNKYFKRVEIIIDSCTIDSFKYSDIIKDEKLNNLTFWYNTESSLGLNNIIKMYNFEFLSFNKDTREINLKNTNKLLKESDIDEKFSHFIINQINRISNDKECINFDTIFLIDDLDENKLETVKEIAKDYDSIKILEYNGYSNKNIIKFDTNISNDNNESYVFDLSILNNLLVLFNNKLYVLNCPIGLEFSALGITQPPKYVKYNEKIDYSKEIIKLNLDSISVSDINLSSEYVVMNQICEVSSLNEETLKKYDDQMYTLFNLHVIKGIYDL